MVDHSEKISQLHDLDRDAFGAPRVGTLHAVDAAGRAKVCFEGSHGVAVEARSTIAAPRRAGERLEDRVGQQVLLVFEDGDPKLPIITGFVSERLQPEPVRDEVQLDLGKTRDVVVDGERVVLDAHREILMRCGKSSILLRKDGKVLVKGGHLVSRSSGPNKIKGGSVSLN